MALTHGVNVRIAAEVPCCSSRPSCSYNVTQPRSLFVQRGRAQRASPKLACTYSVTTPAQLDSARLQDNGVGKAQAGTFGCLQQASLPFAARAMHYTYGNPPVCSPNSRSCGASPSQRACEKRDQRDESRCYHKHRWHWSLQGENAYSFPEPYVGCKQTYCSGVAVIQQVHYMPMLRLSSVICARSKSLHTGCLTSALKQKVTPGLMITTQMRT